MTRSLRTTKMFCLSESIVLALVCLRSQFATLNFASFDIFFSMLIATGFDPEFGIEPLLKDVWIRDLRRLRDQQRCGQLSKCGRKRGQRILASSRHSP